LTLAALTLAVLAWAGALGWVLWADLSVQERDAAVALLQPRRAIAILFVLLLPLGLAGLVWPWARAWPRAARRLREEVEIVTRAHAGHRIGPAGAGELRELAGAIDALAQAHAAHEADLAARMADSNARAAAEAGRLAALMSALTLGVVVCNRAGRILLYNPRAATLLGGESAASGGARIGLDRPLAGVLDAAAIDHAWQQVQHRAATGQVRPVGTLVVARPLGAGATGDSGGLLRVQMVPVDANPAAAGDFDGFVLVVEDVTRAVEEGSRRSVAWLRLTEGTRAALGNLRAAAETLQQYPTLDQARRAQFIAVVHAEAERLARQLADALREAGTGAATAWPLEDMQASDLLLAIQRGLRTGPLASCRVELPESDCWIAVDGHAMVQLLSQLIGHLGVELGVREVVLRVRGDPGFVRLEVEWDGPPVELARLSQWEAGPSVPGGAGASARVDDVLRRHGAEIWPLADRAAGRARLCVQLPRVPAAGAAQPAAHGRPVVYDFDLFHQAGQSAALDETPLTGLSYTVFDTETTGLHPSEGDEIIAIGAVRIVNARLRDDECFDRLTRPRRAVRDSARAVHGISTTMLETEPPLEEVLPQFARFCEGTVLIAHNAAFDMRFLELARARTGVRFDQPVLDTMLLSSVVHPAHRDDEHHLEQLAERLGVECTGRHQALADAVVAGHVFLKLLPLLAERGIVTLGQAREASQRSVQARDRY
jgi:DNA polymerase-3 subunit epsilon